MSIKLSRVILFFGLIAISTIQNFRWIPDNLCVVISIIYIIACIWEIVRETKLRKK